MIESVHALKRRHKCADLFANLKYNFTQCFKICFIVMRFGYFLKSEWYILCSYKYANKSNTHDILKIFYRKLHSVTDLSAATCASTRPVQQHLPSESSQHAVWIRYARRTVLWGTEASPSDASGCCEHTNSERKETFVLQTNSACDWKEQVNCEDLFSFSTSHRLFSSYFLNGTITYCIFLLVVYYMWILIADHGRLRVPWQAKFLSRK